MQCLQNYGSSSDSESESGDKYSHLKPIDASTSVAKTLSVVAAPDVVPMVSTGIARIGLGIISGRNSFVVQTECASLT